MSRRIIANENTLSTETSTTNTTNNSMEQTMEATNTVVKNVNAEKKTVQRTISVRKNENAPEHKILVTIDMASLKPEQLLEWASRAVTITIQGALRKKCTESFLTSLEKRGLVMDATKPSEIDDPAMRLERENAILDKKLESMNVDEIEALMARLQAKKAQLG